MAFEILKNQEREVCSTIGTGHLRLLEDTRGQVSPTWIFASCGHPSPPLPIGD